MEIHERTAIGKVVVPQRHRPLIVARFMTAYRVLEMYFLLKRAVYSVENALTSTPVWKKKYGSFRMNNIWLSHVIRYQRSILFYVQNCCRCNDIADIVLKLTSLSTLSTLVLFSTTIIQFDVFKKNSILYFFPVPPWMLHCSLSSELGLPIFIRHPLKLHSNPVSFLFRFRWCAENDLETQILYVYSVWDANASLFYFALCIV